MSICAHVHAEELIRHVHWHGRIPDANLVLRPHPLAVNHGGQGRMALLDNGGRVGQRGWSSAMYEFCGVEY